MPDLLSELPGFPVEGEETDEESEEPEEWLVTNNGLLSGDVIEFQSRLEGQSLELVFFGGERGLWGTEVRVVLTFEDAEPRKPGVDARVSWYSDVGPVSSEIEQLSGDVFVSFDYPPGEARGAVWKGEGSARIHFTLHGMSLGDPYCVHGKFRYPPE